MLMDTAFVGQVSSLQQAALVPSTSILSFGFSVLFSLSVSLTNFVASNPIKAVDLHPDDLRIRRDTCGAAVCATFFIMGIFALMTSLVLISFPGRLLGLVGASGELMPLAKSYLTICAWGLPFALGATVMQGAFLGQQNAVLPLKVMTIAGLVNLVGDLATRTGITGVAYATVAAQVTAFACFAAAMRRATLSDASSIPLRFYRWRQISSPDILRPLFQVASALTVRAVAAMASYSFMSYFATLLPTAEMAAHQVAFQLWWFLSFSIEPLSTATQSLVAREYVVDCESATRLARLALRMAVACAFGLCALQLVVQTSPLSNLLSGDPLIRSVLRGPVAVMAALSHIPIAVGVMLDGCAIATGNTAALPNIFVFSLCTCVTTLIFAARMQLGILGIWLGMHAFVMSRFVGHVLFSRTVLRLLFGNDATRPKSGEDKGGCEIFPSTFAT